MSELAITVTVPCYFSKQGDVELDIPSLHYLLLLIMMSAVA